MTKKIFPVILFLSMPCFALAQTTTTTTTTTSTGTTTTTTTGPVTPDKPATQQPATQALPQVILPLPQQTLPGTTSAVQATAQTTTTPPTQQSSTPATNPPAAANTASGGVNTTNIGFERFSRIKADIPNGYFNPYAIPFDVPFIMYGPVPKEIKKIELFYYTGMRPVVWPADVNLAGNLTISSSGTTAERATPIQLIGVNSSGDILYSGGIGRSGNVTINGNVLPRDSRTAGVVSWTRNYLNTSTSPSVQDNFFMIIPPLKAITNYRFEFNIYREVGQAEALDLNGFLRPLINSSFKKILTTGYLDHNDVAGAFTDATNADRQDFINKGSLVISKYYHQRDITVTVDEAKDLLASNLDSYIQNIFLANLLDKGNRMKYLESSRTDAQTFVNPIVNDKTLDFLVRHASDYHLSDADVLFIQLTLKNAGELQNIIGAQASADPLDLTTTAVQFQADMKLSADFINKVFGIYIDLNKIQISSDMMTKLNHDLPHQDIAGSIVTLNKFILNLKNFYAALVNLSDATIVLDNTFANANLDFKGTFPLTIKMPGKTTTDFVTRGEWYITADLGFAYIGLNPSNRIMPYLGVNFNIFPINRQADYSLVSSIAKNKWLNILKSTSIVTGLSVIALDSKGPYTDLFGSTSLLTGVGLRLTDGLRITYGRFWSYQKSTNPLISNNKLVSDPYISLSLDWDLRSWLKNFGKQINGFTN